MLLCTREVELDARQCSQPFGQSFGTAVIIGQAGHMLLEGKQTGLRQNARLAHAATQHLAQAARTGDEIVTAHQQRAHRCAQPLGETNRDTVKRCSDHLNRGLAGHGGVKEPGAIEMKLQAALGNECPISCR